MEPYGAHRYENAASAVQAARNQERAQVATMDLAASFTLDGGAYTAVTNSRGQVIRPNHAQDAQMRARVQNRQSQLQTSGNEATRAWNNPDNFEDSSRGLNDQFAGQSHRAQYQSVSGSARPGAGSAPRSEPSLTNQVTGSSGSRVRANSPRSYGTVRFQHDQRVDQQTPDRHERAAAPSPSSDSSHTLSAGPGSDSSHTLSAGSHASIGVNEGARSKSRRRGNRKGKQTSRPQVPSEADLDQPKIDAIVAAATADEVNFLQHMQLQNTDGPTIAKTKAQVVDLAIRSSIPNKHVTQLGPEWVEIFEQTRKSLLAHAVNMLNKPFEEQQAIYSRTAKGVFYHFGKLCTEVEDAMTAAVSNFYSPVTEREWADCGKLDILLKVAENVKPAAEMVHEMDVNTSFEQTVKHVDEASSDLESFGVTTTISGPGGQSSNIPAVEYPGKALLRVKEGHSDVVSELEGSPVPECMSVMLTVSLGRNYAPSTNAYVDALNSVNAIFSEDYRLFKEAEDEEL